MQRRWCAIAQYPGLDEFMAGTAMVRSDAPMHEVEQAVQERMGRFLAPGYAIKKLVPGALWFCPEEK